MTTFSAAPHIAWPGGKEFAFTIFDDPDLDSLDNVSTIYPFLNDLGFRTTKAIWPIRGDRSPKIGGITCDDEQYLGWILKLKDVGFEIALHNATYHTSTREETIQGLETFYRLFGHYPYCLANHSGCQESIYWESARLSGMQRLVYNTLRLKLSGRNDNSQGHIEASSLFWGDLCKQKIRYVRNFVFGDINTLKACPAMPYHDPDRPYVNYWFSASEGPNVDSFNAMIAEENQERLVREGGACIMYTHLASGFVSNGKINGPFKVLMEKLSKRNGWFVPVHTLLDYILSMRGEQNCTRQQINALERKWLWYKVRYTHGRS